MKTDTIQLAHGGGGRLTRDLIAEEILTRFGAGPLASLPDAATLPRPGNDIVFTTDSFVVQPLEFPGGNIGDLAVHGTVNDIAVAGGRPLWLSLAMILEEGLAMDRLRRILDSVRSAADTCGVRVVTGDTKVVPKGQCDGAYLTTAGIGERLPGFNLSADSVRPGDHILVSGTLADHGMAVLAAREHIDIRHGPVSDTAPVHRLTAAAHDACGGDVRFMRDPTRGGLAAVLNELTEGRPFGIRIEETALPFTPEVRATADMLGIDLLHVPSEGRLALVCAPAASEAILACWRAMPEGSQACRIGAVTTLSGRVVLGTITGGRRLVDLPRGELLPRIC
jgi:hydrogenase expression/formation protein HypE